MDSLNLERILTDLNAKNFEELKYFPKYFEIETVNACNAQCRMCTVREWNMKKSDNYIMSMDIFYEFVKQITFYRDWIDTVCLNRDGEPTLDKYLVERVRLLSDINIKNITFSTNAQKLTEDLSFSLLNNGLTDIMISIDTLDEKIFENIRKGLKFKTVFNNILNFISIRNELKTQCSIRIRAIKMDENKNNSKEWLMFWNTKLSKIDRAYIMPLHSWGGQLYNEHHSKINQLSNVACISPFSTMIMHIDGTVPLCGCDYSVKYLMGKFPEKSISEIWSNNNFNKIRNYHKNAQRNKIELCRGCDIWSRDYEE